MEGTNKEPQDEIERKKEFHRVTNNIRNMQKPNETGQGSNRKQMEISEFEDAETMSSGSEITIAVPATNFNRYLRTTGVRYIIMGKASKINTSKECDLQETNRQVE